MKFNSDRLKGFRNEGAQAGMFTEVEHNKRHKQGILDKNSCPIFLFLSARAHGSLKPNLGGEASELGKPHSRCSRQFH